MFNSVKINFGNSVAYLVPSLKCTQKKKILLCGARM